MPLSQPSGVKDPSKVEIAARVVKCSDAVEPVLPKPEMIGARLLTL